jgi:hypothetical protein
VGPALFAGATICGVFRVILGIFSLWTLFPQPVADRGTVARPVGCGTKEVNVTHKTGVGFETIPCLRAHAPAVPCWRIPR